MKNQLTTILLTLFFGSFGIHRFYLGQIFYGLLYIVLAATGISSILAIIDLIMFIIMTEEEFNYKYN